MYPALLDSISAFSSRISRFGLTAVLYRVTRLVLVVLTLGLASLSYAQDSDSDVEFPKDNQTLAIYLMAPYQKISEVPSGVAQIPVNQGRKWRTIQFERPTVPGWVSEDYVRVDGDIGTVLADVLNVRLRPSPQSRVMFQLENGYQSPIVGRYAGFFKVFLPADFTVAIKTDSQLSASEIEAQPVNTIEKTEAKTSVTTLVDSSAPTSVTAAAKLKDTAGLHRIAPGDAISLMVFGEPDLSIENVRVPQSGQVSFPLLGPVTVAGKTTTMVESEMEKLLAQGYVKNPRLSVTIFSYRPIFIRGGVKNTGSFPYTEGLTIAKSIALAGGSKEDAMPNGVSILRDGVTIAEKLPIDSAFEVASGDVISVAEEFGSVGGESFIYIHGEVQQPGEYIYRRGLTVEKAIVLASGFSLRASKRKISITRYAGVDASEPPVEMKRVELYTPVEPGDVINVGASWF